MSVSKEQPDDKRSLAQRLLDAQQHRAWGLNALLREAAQALLDAKVSVAPSASGSMIPAGWRYRYKGDSGEQGEWKFVDSEEECNPLPSYEREPIYTASSSSTAPTFEAWFREWVGEETGIETFDSLRRQRMTYKDLVHAGWNGARSATKPMLQVGWAKLGMLAGAHYVQGVRNVFEGQNDYYSHALYVLDTMSGPSDGGATHG